MTTYREKEVSTDGVRYCLFVLRKRRYNPRRGSPRWTSEETRLLELCLMKYGIGQWTTILNTGLLPGKAIIQLNNQTQRLLGQQSLAVFSGLCLDIPSIRKDNAARTDVTRKAGVIINTGGISIPRPLSVTSLHREAIAEGHQSTTIYRRRTIRSHSEATTSRRQRTRNPVSTSAARCPHRSPAEYIPASAVTSHTTVSDSDHKPLKRRHKIQLLHDLRNELKSRAEHSVWESISTPRFGDVKGTKHRSRRQKMMTDVEEVDDEPLDPSAVEQLISMGYSDRHAMDALMETHNDVDAAVRWLLLNCS